MLRQEVEMVQPSIRRIQTPLRNRNQRSGSSSNYSIQTWFPSLNNCTSGGAAVLLVALLILSLSLLSWLTSPSSGIENNEATFLSNSPLEQQQQMLQDKRAPPIIEPTSAKSRVDDISTTASTIRIVTMNIAECRPSDEAPRSWSEDNQTQALLQQLLKSDPDAVFLQEVPLKDPDGFLQQLQSKGNLHEVGRVPAHAGLVVLLVKRGLTSDNTRIGGNGVVARVTHDSGLPAVIAKVRLGSPGGGPRFWLILASVHLAPFETGSSRRKQQMTRLLELAATEDQELVTAEPVVLLIAGDTNMRDEEDIVMEEELGLMDAWKMAGSQESSRYSWDTTEQDDGSQNRYYGRNTRAYRRRYDRIYLFNTSRCLKESHHPESALLMSQTLNHFELIANQPIAPSKSQFLSDHFGIVAEISLHATPKNNGNTDSDCS